MRIAIVGGGIAGLSAAWRLAGEHDVVVYEAEAVAGGHARTYRETIEGREVAVDLGYQVCHAEHNPNLMALYEALGVATRPIDFSMTVVSGDDAWTSNGRSTPFGDRLRPAIERFEAGVDDLLVGGLGRSLGALLDERGDDADFQARCLGPMLSFWFAGRNALFELPAPLAFAVFGGGAVSFTRPTAWRTVDGGSVRSIEALAGPLGDRLRLSTPVVRVERRPDEVVVTDAGGGVEPFDQVVLAGGAAGARRVLADPTPDERRLLEAVRFLPATVVGHTDPAAMPADRDLWAYGNYVERSPTTDRDQLPGRMTYHPGGPVFASVLGRAGLAGIDPAAVRTTFEWEHMILTNEVLCLDAPAIQGVRRTWFCGGHLVGLPVHEHALCSGLAIAEALGAPYPFAADPPAARVYQALRRRLV